MPAAAAAADAAQEREGIVNSNHVMHKARIENQMRLMQFLSTTIQTMIYLGQMVAPDLSVVFIFLRKYKKFLETQGIAMGARDMIRLWRFAQSLTIMTAIYNVFFINQLGWELDRPFAYADVLECQNFMFGTEQIAAFSLTILGSMFVHPQMDMIIKSVAENNCNYSARCKFNTAGELVIEELPVAHEHIRWYHPPIDANGNRPPIDYNYLSPPLSAGKEFDSITAAANTFMGSFRDQVAQVSRNIVLDVLITLRGQHIRVTRYKDAKGTEAGADGLPAKEIVLPIVDLDEWPRAFKISRHFVDLVLKRTWPRPVAPGKVRGAPEENVLVQAVTRCAPPGERR